MAGVQTVAFADDYADVRIAVSKPRTYFVVVSMTADASARRPNHFSLRHLTDATSTAEDVTFDLPLVLESSANVAADVVAAPADLIFRDGFDG